MKTKNIFIAFLLIVFLSIIIDSNIYSKLQRKNNKVITLTPLTSSSPPVRKWARLWGGAETDYGNGVVIDSSGAVYIVGTTSSFGEGSSDMVLVKYNGNGVQHWNRTWGGTNFDYGYGVAVDSFNNTYIVGYTYSFGAGDEDMVLVKYDENGGQQWNRTWGGVDDDSGFGVTVDFSDNIYIAGETSSFGVASSDMVLVKFNENGVQQWNRTWGGTNFDHGYGVTTDSFNNVYLTGATASFGAGSSDMVLVKYNGNGVQQWNRTWGEFKTDFGYDVAVNSSGDVFVIGATYSFGAILRDIFMVKYNGSGIEQWSFTWGRGGDDFGRGLRLDSSGNIYLVGATETYSAGDLVMLLMKYGSETISTKTDVPSYYLFIILGTLCVSSLFLIKKKYIKNLNN